MDCRLNISASPDTAPGPGAPTPAADTSGFYRLDNGRLLYGPADIHGPGFTLTRDGHAAARYPIDGWTWYDTRDAATTALQPTSVDDRLEHLRDDIRSAGIDPHLTARILSALDVPQAQAQPAR